jgi:hypothetical protein
MKKFGQHKNMISGIIFLLIAGISTSGWCSKIVYPWRSSTAIVKTGETFEVWFDADNGQMVNSVELQGPYNTVNSTFTAVTGDWEYDPLSKNRYNTRLTVTVPVSAPADRYDLILKTTNGDALSSGAVKVVHQFKNDYYIMHFSDGHFYQNGHDTNTLMARKTAMIDIANIMDCEIIIETGDNMYNVRNHPEREDEYFLGIESDGIKGMSNANAATFLVPGDHDAHTANDWPQATVQVNSNFFNDYWGLQNHSFKYGNGRFMMLNNAWGVSKTSGKDHQYQTDDAISWLDGVGSGGNFFLTAGHVYDKMHEFINAEEPLDLVLAGDKHHVRNDNPFPFDDNSVEIAYIAASIRDHFEYNLFKVNNAKGTYIPVSGPTSVVSVLKSGNQDDRSTWESNLTIAYQSANDGSVSVNSATLVNHYNFSIEGAKVRFVVPKGLAYRVINGIITQEFDGDAFHIVDVRVDLGANSTTVVAIETGDLCPDDPDKETLGLCGCGVAEGTCPPLTLTVNSGSGDGDFLPFEQVIIIADTAPKGQEFDTWVINSGSPSIAFPVKHSTTMTVGSEPAEITATYKDLPKVNGATFVSQQIPALLQGETVTVSFTMKNTGTKTWTKDNHYLGSQSPQDNEIWGLNRVGLDEGESVLPNAEKTFTFDITVPLEAGTYIFQWKMLEASVEWFGGLSDIRSFSFGSSGEYLDDCDFKTDWNPGGLILTGSNKVQGTAALEFVGSGTDEYKKVFTTPYNAQGTESGTVLQFWYYVSDPSKFQSSNQVEIGSSGGPDTNEYDWNLGNDLQVGWNLIQLNTKDAGKTGNPDLNAINWFRLYRKKNASVTTRIDAIQLIGENGLSVDDFDTRKSFNIYPNPADMKVLVNFRLSKSSTVGLTLLNVSGQVVSQLTEKKELNPGNHKFEIPLEDISAGVYFMKITIDNAVSIKKIVLK